MEWHMLSMLLLAAQAEYSALLQEREREYSLLLEELRALKSCCSSMAPSRADTRQEGPGSGVRSGAAGARGALGLPSGGAGERVLPHTYEGCSEQYVPGSNQQSRRSRGDDSSLPAQLPMSTLHGSLAAAALGPWEVGVKSLGRRVAGQGAAAAAQLMEPYEYD